MNLEWKKVKATGNLTGFAWYQAKVPGGTLVCAVMGNRSLTLEYVPDVPKIGTLIDKGPGASPGPTQSASLSFVWSRDILAKKEGLQRQIANGTWRKIDATRIQAGMLIRWLGQDPLTVIEAGPSVVRCEPA